MSFWDRLLHFFGLSREKRISEQGAPAGRAQALGDTTPDLAQTAPLRPGDMPQIPVHSRRRTFVAGSAYSTGLQRKQNEDSLLVLVENADGDGVLPNFGLFCVADGAGGHESGEIASGIAVRAVARSLLEDAFLHRIVESNGDRADLEELMRLAFERTQDTINDSAEGGVTTLTVAVLMEETLTIGHVGDTRAYLIEDDQLRLITRDHSVPWRLVEIGQLTPEEALVHPQRNLLWNAMGKGSNLVIDVYTQVVPRPGHLLLCSDGLWGEVPEEQIRRAIRESLEPNQACLDMVRAANANGGADNITAILIHFP
jgi:serine/threonine protein phosphatase PrpC